MTDEDLLALNVYCEAAGEIPDGTAAIARVTLNRMKLHFHSDGTMAGTVLAKDQFSWAWFAFNDQHKYVRSCWTFDQASVKAQGILDRTPATAMAQSRRIALAVSAGAYDGTLYDQLTDDTVLYVNPHILTVAPAWAIPEKRVGAIGHHDFYRA